MTGPYSHNVIRAAEQLANTLRDEGKTPVMYVVGLKGESYYRFWPRTVLGSLRSAWRLDSSRHRLRGRSPWSIRNDILHAWDMTLALFTTLAASFGVEVIPFLILQALITAPREQG